MRSTLHCTESRRSSEPTMQGSYVIRSGSRRLNPDTTKWWNSGRLHGRNPVRRASGRSSAGGRPRGSYPSSRSWAAERNAIDHALRRSRIVQKGCVHVGFDPPRRNTVDSHAVPRPFNNGGINRRIRLAGWTAADPSMSRTATFAPQAANAMEAARPMPRPPPVTTEVLP